MFEWLKSLFPQSNKIPPSNFEFKPPIEPRQSPTNSKKTFVYFWKTTPDGVGHAAIQVNGSKPKMTEDDEGTYISIHPSLIPSIGPTIVLPLPASLATHLSADMESEGAHTQNLIPEESVSIFPPYPMPLAPDRTFIVEGLDTKAMLERINQTREGVDSGKINYQLLPKVNFMKFFRELSFYIAQDPVDIEMHRQSTRKEKESQVYNCSTLVSDILNSGGLPIKQAKGVPWGITPNGLADEIEAQVAIRNECRF